jgi:hypothetical protein
VSLADKALDPTTMWTLRQAAHHLRTVPVHMELLEREPSCQSVLTELRVMAYLVMAYLGPRRSTFEIRNNLI